MKIKIFGEMSELENLLIILALFVVLLIVGFLVWKLVSPFLAIILSMFISYIFFLRNILRNKR